jgi:excisionase family DNA binding protein
MPKTIAGIKVLVLEEASKELGVSSETVRQYVKRGKLKGVKIGTRWHVPWDSIRQFVSGESLKQ